MLHKVLMQIPPDGPAEVAQAVDLYDLEVAYADREVGRFLEELKARDVYEDSLIILTADHGEAFYEHGSWQHGWTLYEENVHVPLIVKWPGNSRRGRTKQLVSQVDIFATLLEQAALASPHSRSTSLTALAAPETSGLVRRHAVSEFITNPSEGETAYKKVSLRTEARTSSPSESAPMGWPWGIMTKRFTISCETRESCKTSYWSRNRGHSLREFTRICRMRELWSGSQGATVSGTISSGNAQIPDI
jgi:hypothetical protein